MLKTSGSDISLGIACVLSWIFYILHARPFLRKNFLMTSTSDKLDSNLDLCRRFLVEIQEKKKKYAKKEAQ